MIEVYSFSPAASVKAGEKIGALLQKGSAVALDGPLGAGKTCLAKGIARFLGVREEITSPTYTIVSEYEAAGPLGVIPFYHIDAYRLLGEDDFYAACGEEIFYSGGVAVVEWAMKIRGALPEGFFQVNIEMSVEGRKITVTGGHE